MSASIDFKKIKNLHHAYGLCGNMDEIVASLLKSITDDFKIIIIGNPDFFHEKFETLTIDDSRRIKEIALGRQFSSDRPRIFVIELYGATREAQNALLKLFEEPEAGNHFFLIMPSSDMLLPTLRSRLQIINSPLSAHSPHENPLSEKTVSAEIFIKKILGEKIAYVDALASDISDDKLAKHAALSFLNDLEKHLYTKSLITNATKHKENLPTFQAISHARTYMNDRAPSLKMLLEYVTLSL